MGQHQQVVDWLQLGSDPVQVRPSGPRHPLEGASGRGTSRGGPVLAGLNPALPYDFGIFYIL